MTLDVMETSRKIGSDWHNDNLLMIVEAWGKHLREREETCIDIGGRALFWFW